MRMDLIKNNILKRILKIETGIAILVFIYIGTLFLPLYSFVSISTNDCKFVPIEKILGKEKNGCFDNVMLFKIRENELEKSYNLSWYLLTPLLLGIIFSASAIFFKNGLIKRTLLVSSGACILFIPLAIFALSQLKLWVLFKTGIGWYILFLAGFLIGISQILFYKKGRIIFYSIKTITQLILGIILIASLALLILALQVKDPFILLDYFGAGRGTEAIFTQDTLFGVNLKGNAPETRSEERIYSSINQADLQKIISNRKILPAFRLDNRKVTIEEIKMTAKEIELIIRQEPKRIIEEEILSGDFDKYTQETEIINFGAPIKNLAEKLENDPLKIFNYVKNNIDYEPYFGIKKEAKGTLLSRKGNDYDQAALLIALLRSGNSKGEKKTPARYVEGKVLLSINEAENLLGVDDPHVAAEIFELNNIPVRLIYNTTENLPCCIEVEFVWVEAYLPYGYYKGLKGEGEKRWIPLVPFLKISYFSQLINIEEEIDFNGFKFWEEYILNPQDFTPFEKYKNILIQHLENNHPDLVYEDILTKEYKQRENLEFLPLGFPFKVIEETGKYAEINDRSHKLRFVLEKDGDVFLGTEVSLIEIFSKRLVLDYEPATENDKQIIDKAGGVYGVVSLTKVNVKPIIKGGGNVIRRGDPVMLGEKVNFFLDFLEPKKNKTTNSVEFIPIEETTKTSITGISEAIAVSAGSSLYPPNHRDGIIIGPHGYYAPKEDLESIPNQMLYNMSLRYLSDAEGEYKEIAHSLAAEVRFRAARAIASSQVNVEYKENQPYKFTWKGLQINATIFGDYYYRFRNERKKYLETVMLIGGLEADIKQAEIFEQTFGVKSLTPVKGFNLVNSGEIKGVNIIKITNTNIEEIDKLPIKEEISKFLKANIDIGNTVYIPNKECSYQTWKGLWYIILDKNLVADYGSIFSN